MSRSVQIVLRKQQMHKGIFASVCLTSKVINTSLIVKKTARDEENTFVHRNQVQEGVSVVYADDAISKNRLECGSECFLLVPSF